MRAAYNFTDRRWLFAFGLVGAVVASSFAFRSLRMVPGEMFPSFALFLCFLAAMAGASCRTVRAGIAQGSAYALILRWLFGTQFAPSTVTQGQSLCCLLPLLTAFCAFVLFHRFTNAFCDRHKPLATNLMSVCRKFCLMLACLYAVLAAKAPAFVGFYPTHDAPLPAVHASAFTSQDSYFTQRLFNKKKTLPRTGTGIQSVSLDGVAESETLNASDVSGDESSTNLTGFRQTPADNPIRGLLSFKQ